MKKIEAIIKRANYPTLATALEKLGYAIIDKRNLEDNKITQAKKGPNQGFTTLMAVPLSKIEMVVSDKDATKVVKLISKKSGLSSNPAGKVFISEMAEVVDMNTLQGETDLEEGSISLQKPTIKRNRLVPLQKHTMIKLERIYDNNAEILESNYGITSFSGFVNYCITKYLPTLDEQLKHSNIIYENELQRY